MGVETHDHNRILPPMGLLPTPSIAFSFSFSKQTAVHRKNYFTNVASKILVALVAFLAISSVSEATSEKDQLATQQKQLNPFQQHLVRRSFLRFGKRSGLDTSFDYNDEDYNNLGNYKLIKREDPSPTGPGEQYAAMIMGKQPHSTSARSFLRFGRSGLAPTQSVDASKRRADNFLRFGKRIPDDHREEQMLGRWKKFLLVMLAKVAEEEDALLHDRQVMDKKSSDFLRFG